MYDVGLETIDNFICVYVYMQQSIGLVALIVDVDATSETPAYSPFGECGRFRVSIFYFLYTI